MQLCDKDIYQAIVNGDIGFVGTNEKHPFSIEQQVQPSSIDLRLSDIIVRFKSNIEAFDIKDKINPNKHLDVKKYEEGKPITIYPGEVVYGQIYEQMWIGDSYSARVEGRSRVARLGLSVVCTGSYINPGFCGAMPLQIVNHNKFPIIIYPYIGICQLVIFQISGEPLVKYSERSRIYNPYYDEKTASPSVLTLDPINESNNQTIVEHRMTGLVQDYYRGLENKKISRNQKKSNDKEIQAVVIQNIQQGGYSAMRDQYSATQVGTQGPGSGQNASITQSYIKDSSIDFSGLENELNNLKKYFKSSMSDEEDSDIVIGEIAKASRALKENRKQDVVEILKGIGNKIYDIAKSIGCTIIAKIIVNEIGL